MKYIKAFESLRIISSDKKEFLKYFKILSLRYKYYEGEFKIIKRGQIIDEYFDEDVDECIANGDNDDDSIRIYSIQRLIDGKVITVGDECFLLGLTGLPRKVGNVNKIWPCYWQMRVDVGSGGAAIPSNPQDDIYGYVTSGK